MFTCNTPPRSGNRHLALCLLSGFRLLLFVCPSGVVEVHQPTQSVVLPLLLGHAALTVSQAWSLSAHLPPPPRDELAHGAREQGRCAMGLPLTHTPHVLLLHALSGSQVGAVLWCNSLGGASADARAPHRGEGRGGGAMGGRVPVTHSEGRSTTHRKAVVCHTSPWCMLYAVNASTKPDQASVFDVVTPSFFYSVLPFCMW